MRLKPHNFNVIKSQLHSETEYTIKINFAFCRRIQADLGLPWIELNEEDQGTMKGLLLSLFDCKSKQEKQPREGRKMTKKRWKQFQKERNQNFSRFNANHTTIIHPSRPNSTFLGTAQVQ